ncbi:hypothetical protein GH714_012314 [Hevea brasiliensis]|uniref:Uncharacterized protein n=1 Tax=Hevea brasiliensis TaxID=3981 RepID=A0A6A6LSF1_HEVBR|nr:hypothetical protein GH714_012314 [Hevea brasiliensis]
MFKPKTLADAYILAKLQELTVATIHNKSKQSTKPTTFVKAETEVLKFEEAGKISSLSLDSNSTDGKISSDQFDHFLYSASIALYGDSLVPYYVDEPTGISSFMGYGEEDICLVSLFAMDAFKMYKRYSQIKGWKYAEVDITEFDLKDYKEASVEGVRALCLWCDEQFAINHDCDKAPFMVSIINDIEDEEDVEFNKEEEKSVDVEDYSWSCEENPKIQGSFDEIQESDEENSKELQQIQENVPDIDDNFPQHWPSIANVSAVNESVEQDMTIIDDEKNEQIQDVNEEHFDVEEDQKK